MSEDTLAEDTDITMAMHRAGWRVVYAENARAWTEAPGVRPAAVVAALPLVVRHHAGDLEAPRALIVDRGPSGRFGRVGLPFVVAVHGRGPAAGPADRRLPALRRWSSGRPRRRSLAWLGVLAVQLSAPPTRSASTRRRMTHLISLPLQQFLYRQLMYLVLLQSWITALTGGRLRWQKLRRTGVVEAPVRGGAGRPAQRRSEAGGMTHGHRRGPAASPDPAGARRSTRTPDVPQPRTTEPAGPGRPRRRAATATSTCCGPSPCSGSCSTTSSAGPGCRSSSPPWA